MFRKLIRPILIFPLCIYFNGQKVNSNESRNIIEEAINEKEDTIYVDYLAISQIITKKNPELKSLNELISASTFNIASKIGKKYPSADLQAIGIPKYIAAKNFNSNTQTTKTSQFSVNPSINIRWDLIDPLRGSEIKIARDNYEIAKNNYEIKRKDLIQEGRARYHKYQKSLEEIKNKKFTLQLSEISLKDAQSKFDAGIGTKFEVLEADAQLSRDNQSLNNKKIEHEINKLLLKEILDIKGNFEVKEEQKLTGYWNYKLNKNIDDGIAKNLSLKNILLKESIKKSQANNYSNATKPNIYISNTFSSVFSKGDTLAVNIDPSESGSSYTNTISLNFTWNIFNGGQNKNLSKFSKAEAKSEEYAFNNIKNNLKTSINRSYLNLKLNEEKILTSLKEIVSTTESLRLSRLRYGVGISTLKDVLIRQKELSNAKSKNIDAIYNYNLKLDELERLTFLKKSNNCMKKNNDTPNDIESICDFKI